MTYVLWVNLSLAILISIFGFYKTFKKWFEDKQKDDPEFPRNSGLTDTTFFMIDLWRDHSSYLTVHFQAETFHWIL